MLFANICLLLSNLILASSCLSDSESLVTSTESEAEIVQTDAVEKDTIEVTSFQIEKMNIQKIGTYRNNTGHTIQGGTLIGETIFQFHDGGYFTYSTLSNYSDKKGLYSLGYSKHLNSLDSYVTAAGDTLVFFDHWRISKFSGKENLVVQKDLTFSGFAGYCHNPAVDWPNGKIYFLEYSKNSWRDSTNNHMILHEFTFDGDYMDNPRLKKYVHMPVFLPAFQDAFAADGIAYYAFGLSSTERGIAMYDARSDDWKCYIFYMTQILPKEEPEALFYKDGYMYMICYSGNFYKMAWDDLLMETVYKEQD